MFILNAFTWMSLTCKSMASRKDNASFKLLQGMTYDDSLFLICPFLAIIYSSTEITYPIDSKSIMFWFDLVCRLCIGWTAKNSLSILKQFGMLLCQISDAGPKASVQLTPTMAKMHEPQEEHRKTGTCAKSGKSRTFIQRESPAFPCCGKFGIRINY